MNCTHVIVVNLKKANLLHVLHNKVFFKFEDNISF